LKSWPPAITTPWPWIRTATCTSGATTARASWVCPTPPTAVWTSPTIPSVWRLTATTSTSPSSTSPPAATTPWP